MGIKYDFHIHSALSPCAMDDMTPNNIVNMAILSGLDVIAITDHNSSRNCEAAMKVAEGSGLMVLAGMEVETAEEVHAVCLFPSLDAARKMQEIVYENLPKLRNKKKIFGNQLIMDEDDEVIGEESALLSFSCMLSIDDLINLVDELGGVLIPAHIDRPSNSIVSNLGEVPEYMGFKTIEISRFADLDEYRQKYPDMLILRDSDAHELGFVGVCESELDCENLNEEQIIKLFKGAK